MLNDFEFEGTVLYLKAGVLLDYERKRVNRVTVDVVDDSFEEGHDLVQITYSLNLISITIFVLPLLIIFQKK